MVFFCDVKVDVVPRLFAFLLLQRGEILLDKRFEAVDIDISYEVKGEVVRVGESVLIHLHCLVVVNHIEVRGFHP